MQGKINKLNIIKSSVSSPKLKTSIAKKVAALKGNKTILK
jgi:hypothetical protein